MQIGKAILDLRLEHHLSQEELAERLFVSRFLVSRWESGTRRPDFPMIERIAEIFGVSLDVIVDKKDLAFLELSRCMPADSPLSPSELAPILNAFLSKLRSPDAEIFIKRYYFFESIAEIALHFHLKENHVRALLSRTRKKLTKYIKEAKNES